MLIQILRPTSGPHPPTVLLVDDEPDILESLTTYLKATMPDVRVVTAASGEEAMVLLRTEIVDVVVSDLRMPGMDGIDLLKSVANRNPSVRRILITAFQEAGLEERADAAGVEALLHKPFSMSEFRELVSEGLA
ncbi:MAG: response regulator [Thermoplasmatota archaeon]